MSGLLKLLPGATSQGHLSSEDKEPGDTPSEARGPGCGSAGPGSVSQLCVPGKLLNLSEPPLPPVKWVCPVGLHEE